MKKRRLIYALTLVTGALLISQLATSKLTGSFTATNGNVASDPGANDCTKCHTGTAIVGNTTLRVFMLDTMATGFTYTPGADHTIKFRIYGNNNVGFATTVLKADNSNAGTLANIDVNETRTYTVTSTSRNYLCQKNGTNTGPYKEYSFKWTAPAVGTGDVKFYFSSLNGDGADDMDNDTTYNNVYTIAEKKATGLNAISNASFSVYPNPVIDQITVNFNNSVSGQINVSLYSLDGKQSFNLMNDQLNAASKSLNIQLPAGVQSGIYFVKIENAGNTSVQKILVY